MMAFADSANMGCPRQPDMRVTPMHTRNVPMLLLLGALVLPGVLQGQTQNDPPKLKTRTDVPAPNPRPPDEAGDKNSPWVIPAGTKFPVELRQAISTKNAKPGDPIYARTAFPVLVDGKMMIPAETYIQGEVDSVKRAGRIKGTAELRFHLTRLIYPNGYILDISAILDQVPGDEHTHMKEPGTVTHDPGYGNDLKQIADASAKGAQLGSVAGATSGSIRGVGIGGLTGAAIGILIGILMRGEDVRFETGTVVEISLNGAVQVDQNKVLQAAKAGN